MDGISPYGKILLESSSSKNINPPSNIHGWISTPYCRRCCKFHPIKIKHYFQILKSNIQRLR